jgi:hypothetical protein
MLFGATPAANAASAVPAPTVGGPYHVAPVFWGHHHHTNGGFHIF